MSNQLKITGIEEDTPMNATVDFASTLAELEKIVTELDSDIPIERALELFEKGMKLSIDCEKFLTSAEQRIELLKRSADNSVTTEPFQQLTGESGGSGP
jgi:exodeoxyribonuclease VII small subunit